MYVKGFALGLALKQRRKATRKSPIDSVTVFAIDNETMASAVTSSFL